MNFRSWNPENENDLDEVFILLVSEPEHRNNGTLAGSANEQLANTLRSGGWIFEGYKGVSVKPNSPRTNPEGKVIKYESPRGVGNQQIFIPRVSVRVGHIIAAKIGQDAAIEYTKRNELRSDLETFLNGTEIVLAFDRDDNPSTIRKVEHAQTLFVREIEGEARRITQIKWRGHKGIDDYIAAKGVKAIDRAYAARSEISLPKPKEERKTCGDSLLEIGKTATYFHTADKVPYADIWIEGSRHTYPVRSKAFRLWLAGEYLNRTEKGIGSQTLQETLQTLEAISIFRGGTRQVHLRTAEHQGKIYIDLGTPDWKAIEVDSSGWRLVSDPPVRFWRPESLLALPCPVVGNTSRLMVSSRSLRPLNPPSLGDFNRSYSPKLGG